MKIFCISDSIDIAVGLRLSGINSITLNEKQEIINKIQEITNQKDIGILVVTKNIYKIAKDEIEEIKLNKNLPLIVQINNE